MIVGSHRAPLRHRVAWRGWARPSIVAPNPGPGPSMAMLRMIFIWWRGATLGTLVTTWFSGQFVGEDAFGNRYYQNKTGLRRWVLYNGTVEASRVPPDWHG